MNSGLSCTLIGAGAIGSVFATYLTRAGIKVYVIQYGDMNRNKFKVALCGSELSGRYYFPVKSVQEISPSTTLLIATKATQVLNILREVKDFLTAETNVIILSNGMGFHEKAEKLCAPGTLFVATTTQAAHFQEDGKLNHVTEGETMIGSLSNKIPPPLFYHLKNALVNLTWRPDIRTALWEKFAINCAINPMTAAYKCRNGHLVVNSSLNRIVKKVCYEIERVGCAAGYRNCNRSLYDEVFEVANSTSKNLSSMLQDINLGRATEIESITGHLVWLAKKYQIDIPENKKLLLKIREISLTNR